MSLTVRDVEDAWMDGAGRFAEWVYTFEREWMRPVDETMTALALAQMDSATYAQVMTQAPDAVETLMQRFGFDGGG
ncbi:MAG: hypothetical protein D6740_07630 [Alphaproteobacteria bacterium]|nr:MAG: hypothetical protein D6740_07630 [Alphaproteobacteria bacterium]